MYSAAKNQGCTGPTAFSTTTTTAAKTQCVCVESPCRPWSFVFQFIYVNDGRGIGKKKLRKRFGMADFFQCLAKSFDETVEV